MSADEYKNYLLGLIFYKYLSDRQLYAVAYSKTHEGVSKLKYNRRAKDAVVELVKRIRPLREK